VYPASDGYISVGALEPQFWSALCAAIERSDLVGDAFAAGERRDEVIAELTKVFASRSRDEWMKLLEGLDVCVGPVNDFAETFADEQVLHREMVVEADLPGVGPWPYVGNPIKLASADGALVRLPPPGLGEHTAEVLAEVGVNEEDIAGLKAAGTV
jgi:crotonobetainyl-CoA:carnitine CoA-transferase CaiB-like acyl-CoA transferase